jgi:integrase
MACIQKLKRANTSHYRAIIKHKGIKTITKVFNTRKLAVEFAKRIEGSRELLLAYGSSHYHKISFKELINRYFQNEYKGSDPKGQKHKLNFWISKIGDKNIEDITKSEISIALQEFPSKYSNATVNRYKAALSVVFSYACRNYNLADNPVRYIPSRPENNQRTRYLFEIEREKLFASCKQSRWGKLYLLVLMAITTGARKGELMNLDWSDIDFERQTAIIIKTKNGQPKSLPLTSNVIDELNKFKESKGLVFASKTKPSSPYCINKTWKIALLTAKIEDFRFHDLRHTTASYLAQSGASLLEIAEVLGHKQIQMTKRYSHLCIDHKQKLINRVLGSISDT